VSALCGWSPRSVISTIRSGPRISEVAHLLGVGCAETVRKWVRQGQVDAGARPGITADETAELKRLQRENAELRRANAILKTASAFFAAEAPRNLI
jgi:transposase-like protein